MRGSVERFVAPEWHAFARQVCLYLAARSFANWTLQMGGGVTGHIASVAGAHDVLVVEATRLCERDQDVLNAERLLEAFRAADNLLLHLARHDSLASLFGAAGAAIPAAERRQHPGR